MKTKRIQSNLSSSANMIVMIKWKDGTFSVHFCLNNLDDVYSAMDTISDPANADGFTSLSLADMKQGESLDTWMNNYFTILETLETVKGEVMSKGMKPVLSVTISN